MLQRPAEGVGSDAGHWWGTSPEWCAPSATAAWAHGLALVGLAAGLMGAFAASPDGDAQDRPRDPGWNEPRLVYPGADWERREPSTLGLDYEVLDEIVETAGGTAGIIVRYGYVARAWGGIHHDVYWGSASKPLLSMLLFAAVAEDRLPDVHAAIAPLWPQLRQPDRRITFHHLANNISGYGLPERPGRAWAYNDYAMNLFCRSLRTVFDGAGVDELVHSRLGALGFQDPVGNARDGCAASLSVRDLARIATLWLRDGKWHDQSVLDSDLLARSLTAQVPRTRRPSVADNQDCNDYIGVGSLGAGCNETPLGPGSYGYGLWFNEPGGASRPWPDAPRSTYLADGVWGAHLVVVIPELELVAVIYGEPLDTKQDYGRINRRLKTLLRAVVH